MTTTGVVKKTQRWISSKNLRVSVSRRRSHKDIAEPSTAAAVRERGAREEELLEVFQHFDGDGDGRISPSELKGYFRSIGEYMSLEEAAGVVRVLDGDGDQLLDFDDFLGLMGKENGREEDLRKAFEMFEMEDVSAGSCITPRGLQRTLSRLGEKRSYEECVTMVRAFDVDGNGVIDFHEFHQMMAV